MQCENIFCIYWEEERCILDEVSLDVMGCCQSCIYIDIDAKDLQAARKEQLNRE